jgi:hypothetical protein
MKTQGPLSLVSKYVLSAYYVTDTILGMCHEAGHIVHDKGSV